MEMNLRKIWPLVGAMCLSLTGSAFAHSTTQNSSSSAYGSSMDSKAHSGNMDYQRGTFREITPSAGPRVAHGADVFITADFLWWKTTEDGVYSSGSGVISSSNTDTSATPATPAGAKRGKVVSTGDNWAPGFKVGLGLNMGHDGWDVLAEYTWLNTSNSTTQKGPYLYDPLYVDFVNGVDTDDREATGNWNTRLNTIDLELGRNFYLSQFLTMRPHIGLKGTWQKHDWKVSGVAPPTVSAPNTETFNKEKGYDVWAVGVRTGLNTSWYMTKSLSLYGDLAVSTLYTNYYRVTDKSTTVTANDTITALVDTSNDSLYGCKYVAELEIGLRWEMWFSDDNYHFAVQAGWEQQSWINWSIFNSQFSGSAADYGMQGVSVKFRFDF